ncbi:MAG: sterol desaturase family protein, partial [Nitrospinaceae bacterium]
MDTNQIRFTIFISVFFLMLVLERFLPRHSTVDSKWRRLGINLGLTGLNTLVIKGMFGAAAVGVAMMAEQKGWGLLNWIQGPELLKLVLA